MQKFTTLTTSRLAVLIGGVVLALGLIWPFMVLLTINLADGIAAVR